MQTEPVKYRLFQPTATGRLHRFIGVEFNGDDYRVQMKETIHTNTQHHGLLSGHKSEPTAQSRRNTDALGQYQTLDEANAKARAVYEKLQAEAWADDTPAATP